MGNLHSAAEHQSVQPEPRAARFRMVSWFAAARLTVTLGGTQEMITVRPSLPEDSDGIQRVTESGIATLRQTYRPNQKALENRRQFSSQLCRLVALIDGDIAGTTQFYLDGKVLRIIGLFAQADCRRRGVERALIEGVAGIARKQRIDTLAARRVQETGNVPVFEKIGFELSSVHPDVRLWCMQKDHVPA